MPVFITLQIDCAERGFSFMGDGPIDMRMDPSAAVSAEEVRGRGWGEGAQLTTQPGRVLAAPHSLVPWQANPRPATAGQSGSLDLQR